MTQTRGTAAIALVLYVSKASVQTVDESSIMLRGSYRSANNPRQKYVVYDFHTTDAAYWNLRENTLHY